MYSNNSKSLNWHVTIVVISKHLPSPFHSYFHSQILTLLFCFSPVTSTDVEDKGNKYV